MQRKRITVLWVWKLWTDDNRTTRKYGRGTLKVTSTRDEGIWSGWRWWIVQLHLQSWQHISHLLQVYHCLLHHSSASSAQWIACKHSFIQDSLHAKSSMSVAAMGSWKLRLPCRLATIVFCDKSHSLLWYYDGRIYVRRNARESYLLGCIIKRHSGRTTGVMVWSTIAYHAWSQLLWIVMYIRDVQ